MSKSTKPKQRTRKSKAGKKERHATNAGVEESSLAGFQPVMWPTMFPAKLVYSDYRVVTCSGSQAEYVYRLNSVFDPDVTGVGGQPDGFDQLKALYGRYRVVATDVEVEAVGQAANGFVTMAPTDVAGGFTSAEEVAGLRNAVSSVFSSTESGKLRARWHISRLLGYSDESLLANPNCEAAISANPAFQHYLTVAIEGGSSATQSTNLWVKLTYYVRMEVPFAILDSAKVKRLRFQSYLSASRTIAAAQAASVDTEQSNRVDTPGTRDPQAPQADARERCSTFASPPELTTTALPPVSSGCSCCKASAEMQVPACLSTPGARPPQPTATKSGI